MIDSFWNDEIHKKYPSGCDMNQFKHIPDISFYDHNYYVGFNNDLLYGHGDDDNTTEWFLIKGEQNPIYLGVSHITNNEKLIQERNF
jgi:hypothetical protein